MKTIAKIGLVVVWCVMIQEAHLQGCCAAESLERPRTLMQRAELVTILSGIGTQPRGVANIIFDYVPEILCTGGKICTLKQPRWNALYPVCRFSADNKELFIITVNGVCVTKDSPNRGYRKSYGYRHSAVTGHPSTTELFFYNKSYRHVISSDTSSMNIMWELRGCRSHIVIEMDDEIPLKPLVQEEYDKAEELQRSEAEVPLFALRPQTLVYSDDGSRVLISRDDDGKNELQVWLARSRESVYATCVLLTQAVRIKKKRWFDW